MTILRSASVYVRNACAGSLYETDEGYSFVYDPEYLSHENAAAISLTMPVQEEPYQSKTLFPFFDGLIPEGWLLDIVMHNWKISSSDRFGLLLAACKDPIGCVWVKENS